MTPPISFGEFEADLDTGELRRHGVLVPIQDLPFRLLAALLRQPGRVVSRADLAATLWGETTFVDFEAGLNTAVAKLREALGDTSNAPLFIETLPKRGYRFIGAARPATPADWATPGLRTARRWRNPVAITAAVMLVAAIGLGLYRWRASTPQVVVAVVLFQNETGRPENDRFAQQLTDATVFQLTSRPALAVIGNAKLLRTSRPFMDLAAIRDALHANYIVIGQVQTKDGATEIRTHLIRAGDLAHVWVRRVPVGTRAEGDLQIDVAAGVDAAIATYVAK